MFKGPRKILGPKASQCFNPALCFIFLINVVDKRKMSLSYFFCNYFQNYATYSAIWNTTRTNLHCTDGRTTYSSNRPTTLYTICITRKK